MVNIHIIIEFFSDLHQNNMVNIFFTFEISIAMSDITKTGADTAKTGLIPAVDDSSAHMLRTIEDVEEHLREKRGRIEELQSRHDELAEELRQLNESLDSESLDFVSNLKAVINDLDAGGTVVALQPVAPADASTAAVTSDAQEDGADRSKPTPKSAKEKPVKRSSLRWLKDKDRSRRDDSKPLIPGADD